ncbi:hypothetical protein [Frankia sp. R43]|uniref:hypothetical protein n=1 Tax=Frankia sp. R43 TaxID=269536 RepID=UPI000A5B11C4|nr:hypothetical protein [Frankia sp. R43]
MLRPTLAHRGLGYVLAVATFSQIDTKAGPHRAIDALPVQAWIRICAGQGGKRQQLCDSAFVATSERDLLGSQNAPLFDDRQVRTWTGPCSPTPSRGPPRPPAPQKPPTG